MAKPRTSRRPPSGIRNSSKVSVAWMDVLRPLALLLSLLAMAAWWFNVHYSVTFQSPITVRFRLPFVLTARKATDTVAAAELDQNGKKLTGWQRYACQKFGPDCRLALAIQRAENAPGKCEIYHYNSDGSLDWGYFQINTIHLQRSDLNLRDLLDCKTNIDFAHKLYVEHSGFGPWSTFRSGAYRQFLR